MSEPSKIIELAMRHHLPVSLGDGLTMCLCADVEGAPNTQIMFDGPVYQRRHVAERIIEDLLAAGWLPPDALEQVGWLQHGKLHPTLDTTRPFPEPEPLFVKRGERD